MIGTLRLAAALLFFSPLVHAAGDAKSANIYVNPLSALQGYYTGGLDFALGNATLGPTGGIYSSSGDGVSTTGIGYGLRLNYYFRGAIKSSWRVSLIYLLLPLTVKDSSFSAKVNDTTMEGLIGYHWVGNRLNFALGAGLSHYSTNESLTAKDASGAAKTIKTPGYSGTSIKTEASIGWGF